MVKDYVLSASRDSVKLISENLKGFTIVKMAAVLRLSTQCGFNLVQVAGGNLADKVLASLNSGALNRFDRQEVPRRQRVRPERAVDNTFQCTGSHRRS